MASFSNGWLGLRWRSNVSEVYERVIDDAIWEELLAFTGGAAAKCYQCGTCTAVCPWGLVSEETISIRALIREAQLGLPIPSDSLWLCTTCASCEAYCPRGVKITDVILGLRQWAWHEETAPAGYPSLLWSVYWNDNPWSQPPSQRALWAKNLDLPYYDPDQHDILLYVGCTSAYDQRAQKIAKAFVHILRTSNVSFGVLLDDEPCCGESVLSIGHKSYFQEVASHAAQILDEKGVTQMVVLSPHCFDAFKNHNTFLNDRIDVVHYTSFLVNLLQSGQLEFTSGLDCVVTYHDPCYLARHNQEIRAPREILSAIPGLILEEMAHSEGDTLCCGAGGGRMWMETDPGMRFADLRVHEAKNTKAELIATACPFCLTCLEDSVKGDRTINMSVKDIAEIAALACRG
jgi:Fe-S oxidoreductase